MHPTEGDAIRHEEALALAEYIVRMLNQNSVRGEVTSVKATPISIAKAILSDYNVTRKL